MEPSSRPPNDPSRASVHQDDGAADALRAELAEVEAELARARRAAELALDLVAEQEQRLAQVRALADMAEWASSAEPEAADREPTIRVSDLRHALR